MVRLFLELVDIFNRCLVVGGGGGGGLDRLLA
jgi:hypothetical protein